VESANLDHVQQLLVDVVAAGANEIEAVDFDVIGKGDMRAQARRRDPLGPSGSTLRSERIAAK